MMALLCVLTILAQIAVAPHKAPTSAAAANRVEFILFTDFRGSPVIFIDDIRIDGVPSLEKLLEYVKSKLAVTEKSEVRRP